MRVDIDTLAKGKDGTNVKNVLRNCAMMRSLHRTANRGFSVKKTKRYLADIPYEIQFLKYWTCPACGGFGCVGCGMNGKVRNPYYGKYFNKEMDRHEKKKGMYEFLRKHPEFMCVDKL